jgi:hypothetical protein
MHRAFNRRRPKPRPLLSDVATDGAAASSGTRTIQEQVAAATALAEHVTVANSLPRPPPIPVAERYRSKQVAAATALAEQVTASTAVPAREQKADITVGSGQSETVLRGDAEKTTPVSPSTTDLLVALVMARPEIKSVSDLADKNVAIDDRQTESNNNVRTAIVAAGAAEVQLSDSQTKVVDRLISGEVSAAVLTLVSREAAEWFPDIAGFNIFRIPIVH